MGWPAAGLGGAPGGAPARLRPTDLLVSLGVTFPHPAQEGLGGGMLFIHSQIYLFIHPSNFFFFLNTLTLPRTGAMETNNTGFLPSGTHSLVGKVDQYAKQSRKVICRVTGMCKSLALPENVEKADLEDGLRMPGGWKRLELAKELCLRTMARLRGFQSRE